MKLKHGQIHLCVQMVDVQRVAVVGAGVSGLVAIQECLENGLQPVCFEQHDQIGK